MNQIMELRSQIEGHEELGELVELDFRSTKIKWKNFHANVSQMIAEPIHYYLTQFT